MKQIAATIYLCAAINSITSWCYTRSGRGHFTAPRTHLIYFEDGKRPAAAEYRGLSACLLMQTHTYLLNGSAWVEAPLTGCTSREPFSHTGPNKPALLVSLITRTRAHTHKRTHACTPASHSNVSQMTCGEREECVLCALWWAHVHMCTSWNVTPFAL